jgi:hypothetical protein
LGVGWAWITLAGNRLYWVMHHQEDAAHLLPEYNKIRQQATERDEAQKTHCGQDI